uniref:MFS general substrate transporter n=1 Tax=Mycena chlorophos TaxID=658473 RepID=A0ABQ0LRQ9_MYCCL|nr:MFS general substrate transporter [Mycena chlorophos]
MATPSTPTEVVSVSATITSTPRSSFTLHDPSTAVSPVLERELENDEEEIHQYGGDAPHEPQAKSPALAPQLPSPRDPEEVTWDGPDDPTNPYNWSDKRKWQVTLTCIIMTVNVTFASSAPSSATTLIAADFDVPAEVSYLITSVFLLGYVFGPLLWGSGSELIGRRPVFVVAMSLYTILHLGQALAKNIETLLITRFLGGVFAVAPLVNAGGVIADIWAADKRGLATSLFSASVFLGPVMGPIVAGYIVQSSLGWRWVFWVMMIFAGSCTIIMILTLPETYAPVLLLNKAKARRLADPVGSAHLYAAHEKQDWTPRGIIHRTLFRPFQMLAGEPILVLVTIYLSLIYGVMYALFEAFPVIFVQKRGFTIAQDGLIFIGIGIGTSLGAYVNVLCSRHYPTLIKKWRGFPPAEERLWGGMIGSCAFVVGIFWLGWTGNYDNVPWYVPALSTPLIGMSIALIFMSFLSYLVDTYLMFSASAFAANTFCRSLVAAAFPLFTVQMFDKLGVNWAATLLGLVGLLLAPSPFLFYRYGAAIRARSKFAPCMDLKIKKELEAEAEGKQPEKTV